MLRGGNLKNCHYICQNLNGETLSMAKCAVVALGGNALLRGHQKGTAEEQLANIAETLENVIPLIKEGYNLVIGHGNGPQVGNVLMQNAGGEEQYGIPAFPLDVCVAETEGSIGYMLERELRNLLVKHGLKREVCCLLAPVVVDKNDPAFSNPTKRVGRSYTEAQAEEIKQANGWAFKSEERNEGVVYRRVVPSPAPAEVLHAELIKRMVNDGVIVIAVGGGGVPVARDANGMLEGVEAVIDKDSASSLLASSIGADEFYILTDVPYVYLNFKKPDEKRLEKVSLAEIKGYLAQGMFGEGNMAPKIRACASFLEKGGKVSIITEATKLADRKAGTHVTL